jgi:hypothetical protein
MKTPRQAVLFAAVLLAFTGGVAFAQGRGRGQEHGKSNHPTNVSAKSATKVSAEFTFGSHERDEFRVWYRDHQNNLPPGLAKRDRLPPGLERQLRERGTLPPGLRKKIVPLPVTLVRVLPPPPPGCSRVIIGGNIVLMDTKTFYVHAVFSF